VRSVDLISDPNILAEDRIGSDHRIKQDQRCDVLDVRCSVPCVRGVVRTLCDVRCVYRTVVVYRCNMYFTFIVLSTYRDPVMHRINIRNK
jgi:hypothetical protein